MAEPLTAEFPLGFVWRVEMALPLEGLPAAPPLRPGLAFAKLDADQLPALARIEHAAFAGTPDAVAFAFHLGSVEASLSALQGVRRSPRFDARGTLVVRAGDAPVGFAMATAVGQGMGFLHSVAVLPEHRGGTGRALVVESLRRMRAGGVRLASLTVTAENAHALRLYERLGFQEMGWSLQVFRRPA